MPQGPWTAAYDGVRIRSVTLSEPRPLRIHAVEVNLEQGPRLVVSASNGERPQDVDGQTTLTFAVERGCQVALNASPFDPVAQAPGEPKDIVGLAVADGAKFSDPHPNYSAFAVDGTGHAKILRAPIQPAVLAHVRLAVGGFQPLILDGADVSGDSNHVRGRHPRTAVGVSADGTRVWFVVVDGRQPGVSEGVRLRELSQILASFGAHDALNLDGGGSSTLVVDGPDGHRVVNSPIHAHVPGRLRVVGNSLCVLAPSGIDVSSR